MTPTEFRVQTTSNQNLNRKIVKFLLLAFVLFVLYNTLIPFHFQMQGKTLGELARSFEWELFQHEGKHTPLTDIAGNILLFIPFGFLMFTFLWQRRIRGGIVISTILGFLLSVFIEVLQLFLISRNSSITDVVNNTLGSFMGAFAAYLYEHTIADFTNRKFRYLLKEQPYALVLVIAFTFQALAAILPFNVSITVSDLKRTLKNIVILPFQNVTVGRMFLHHPTKLDSLPFDWYAFWENALFWVVLGYIASLCYFLYWQKQRGGKLLWFSVAFLPPVLIEMMQIFIVSRFADVNDILSAWLGIFLGSVIYLILRPHRVGGARQIESTLQPAILLYLLFILFAGLQPFQFESHLVQSLDIRVFIPFYAYFKKTSIWNIYDLINSLLYFVPISLYLSYKMRLRKRPWSAIYFITVLTGFSLGAFIEICQLFSPFRVSEITDALLYGIGGFLGTFVLYYYQREIKPNLSDIPIKTD